MNNIADDICTAYHEGYEQGRFDGIMNATDGKAVVKGYTVKAIVLCKNCKYWQDNNDGYPVEECRWGHEETPDADDFCSFGESAWK